MGTRELLFEDFIAGGAHWSLRMRRGTVLRLIDRDGGANVGMLFYNPENLLERYNMPDTLKCQHTFRLRRGTCLYSDMGRIFCSVIEDSVGWHDTVCGTSSRALVAARWGERAYQAYRNDWTRNGRDSFLVELAKYGLGRRDLAANVNWFSKVSADADGALTFHPGHSRAGDAVALRFEMDTLVVLHTCPHPLDPSPVYPRRGITYQVLRAEPVGEDDECLNSRPENRRGFENNRRYHACGGGVEAGGPPALRETSPETSASTNAVVIAPPRRVESPRDPAAAIYRHVIPAGDYWLHHVQAGQVLRIVDCEGNQAADTLFFSAADPAERYSAVDTIRAQGNLYLGVGTALRSTADNVLLEIVADTVGRHDTIGGACAAESNSVRYALEKKTMHACRDSWMLAVAEHDDTGLTKRDITHNINFFMNVPVTPEGGLEFADGLSGPGQYVELRAAMDVYALISNCPQLNNPCNAYNPTPVEVLIFPA